MFDSDVKFLESVWALSFLAHLDECPESYCHTSSHDVGVSVHVRGLEFRFPVARGK